MTGNSRRQVLHHSAQKIMYTGFTASDNVYDSPEASTVVKSGAAGPSGGGFWGSPLSPVGESAGVSGGDEGAVDDDSPGAVEPVSEVSEVALAGAVSGVADAQAAATMANATITRRRFIGSTVPAAVD
jgi:hypothetical protein